MPSFQRPAQDGDDHREMWLHFDCNGDYSEVHKGPKIIFSLGAWGDSETLIQVVGNALREFGDFYFVANDCSDDWVKNPNYASLTAKGT